MPEPALAPRLELDFLGLWLADLSMVERQSAVDEPNVVSYVCCTASCFGSFGTMFGANTSVGCLNDTTSIQTSGKTCIVQMKSRSAMLIMIGISCGAATPTS